MRIGNGVQKHILKGKTVNKKISDLISKDGKENSFTRVVPTKRMLEKVKEQLGFSVPEQFLEFLNKYSYGGFGFEIYGIGFDGSIAFLDETLEYRKIGLPENLLVIENCDEWLYCIDTNTDKVVSWYPDGEPCVDFSCFDDFLLERLNDSIENM